MLGKGDKFLEIISLTLFLFRKLTKLFFSPLTWVGGLLSLT